MLVAMKTLQTLMMCKEAGFISTVFILDPAHMTIPHNKSSMFIRVLSRMTSSRLTKYLRTAYVETFHPGAHSTTFSPTNDRAGSMTLDGVKDRSCFHQYAPILAAYAPGISSHHEYNNLQSLRLRNMQLRDVCWPNMPSLTHLSIESCTWTPCTIPNETDTPLLNSLHIVRYRPLWNEVSEASTLVLHIIPHIRRLRTLSLDLDIYYLLFKDRDLADHFTQLEELGVNMARDHSGAVWNDSILPLVVPPSLRVFWVSADHAQDKLPFERYPHHVFVLFDPEYASYALQGPSDWSSSSPFKYDEVRLAGIGAFWSAVSPELLRQAKEIVDDHVIEWTAKYGESLMILPIITMDNTYQCADDSHLGQIQAIHDDLSRNPFQTFGIVVWWGTANHSRYSIASSLSL
jgi:hypothetical protein